MARRLAIFLAFIHGVNSVDCDRLKRNIAKDVSMEVACSLNHRKMQMLSLC